MSLFSALTGVSSVLGGVFGDEMAYHHKADASDQTVTAIKKNSIEVQDGIGGPPRFQDVTWFRVTTTLPWAVTEMTGDTITDLDGKTWWVEKAQRKGSGITHLYVQDCPL